MSQHQNVGILGILLAAFLCVMSKQTLSIVRTRAHRTYKKDLDCQTVLKFNKIQTV